MLVGSFCTTQELSLVLCDDSVMTQTGGIGWGGREAQEGGDACIPIVVVKEKLTQHCKAIILRKKERKEKTTLSWGKQTKRQG